MKNAHWKFTYINGPTVLIDINGLRLLTDPTFDPGGEEYNLSLYTLKKVSAPAIAIEELGDIDAVLLSHDHHFDNLDRKGRAFLPKAKKVITTKAAAERLGGNSIGLSNWESIELQSPGGGILNITGTPARHGPKNGDRGPVSGFILKLNYSANNDIYISGDTVWYEGIKEINRRYNVRIAFLFMGAARVPEVSPDHLTFTAEEGIKVAALFKNASIIPLHYEGWKHFSESRRQIEETFIKAGLSKRMLWMEPGSPLEILI